MVLFRRKGYRVEGEVSPGFESVRELFEEGFARGLESAAQLCVYVGHECVVDLWGVSGKDPFTLRDSTM